MDDISIEYESLIKETEAAYQILIDDQNIWLPKSQVRIYPKNKKVHLPEWLALKKGLI